MILLVLVLVLGCLVPGDPADLGAGDSGDFVENVEPILVSSCANPSCHGNAQRPLQLYAVHRYRLDPDDLWADGDLSPAEHLANYQHARGFGAPTFELGRKPLSPEAGGMDHRGGVFWNTTDDVDYQAIIAWLEGR